MSTIIYPHRLVIDGLPACEPAAPEPPPEQPNLEAAPERAGPTVVVVGPGDGRDGD